MTLNRVVALLTPLVFAPLAGTCAAWIAEHFPGVEIEQDQLQQIFIAGALIALAPAAQWLHGWQKHEARLAEAEKEARAAAAPAAIGDGFEPEFAVGEFADDAGEFADEAGEFGDDAGEFDVELDEETAGNGQPIASGG